MSYRAYYQLTKPGVTYGNVLTVVAGYFLAAAGDVQWPTLMFVTIGMTLVIASACSINNYLDQDIDKYMERTKKRPSIQGKISDRSMVVFGSLLFVLGMLLLIAGTNLLTCSIAVTGFITYVWLYGALSKRRSVHGTVVGSVSGAMPIIAGYAAARGHIDSGLILAFLILFFWQFPEFYSIAIYRRKEYAAARIPVSSVVRGVPATIRQIFTYTLLYVFSTLGLALAGYAGGTYFVVMLAMGAWWIWLGYQGLKIPVHAQDKWARKMFKFSMITILVLCGMLAVGPILP